MGLVLTYPFFFENGDFFLCFGLPSARTRENGHRKCIFKKLSREETFKNSALSFSYERTKTEVFEYGDLINHTAPIRIRYV